MAASLRLTRVEGGLLLEQGPDGQIRLPASAPRGFERRLIGRGPLEAVFLCQQITADGGIAHALASVTAWEQAGAVPVAENGRQLRELLLAISLAHAHLRHFYLGALPDYLPWGTLADYEGSSEVLLELRASLAERPRRDWTRQSFEHPFTAEERDRLWEHRAHAIRQLGVLQRMLAVLGGKYPVAMSLVPGGINLDLNEQVLLKLRAYLGEVRRFLEEQVLDDGLLLVRRYPGLKSLGRGVPDFLCTGSGEDEAALEGALFPSGVVRADRLEPFAAVATESIRSAFYRIRAQGSSGGTATQPQPDKQDAYSWIKAPRYQGKPMETGPFARLVITYLSGARMSRPELVDELERQLGTSVRRSNTVAGRLLARVGELGTLMERAETLLDQIDPVQPTVSADIDPFHVSGEGLSLLESPAGSLQHRVILERGRIVHYDIVSPCTWNGAPRDEQNLAGSLETALSQAGLDLGDAGQQRVASRIVQSFAFSATDAVQ
jgi:Ni,Fe-hydrogenase I large subunit